MDTQTPTKPVTFVVALTVDASWIADGFTLTDEKAKNMLSHLLNGAHGSEIGARVIMMSESRRDVFEKYQGYATQAAWMREANAYRNAAPHIGELAQCLLTSKVAMSARAKRTGAEQSALNSIERVLALVQPFEIPQD